MQMPAAPGESPHRSGEHEQQLAAGALAQQVALTVSSVTMLVVLTVLARRMSLSEFGVYGLLISIPTYLLFAQGSVEAAGVRAIAQAQTQQDQDRALTTALSVYICFGIVAAALIVFGGFALLSVFRIPPRLHADAQMGLLTLGIVNVAAWPAKAAQDALRGNRRFLESAAAEACAYLCFGVLIALALALSGPLWLLVALGGSIPLMVGAWSCLALLVVRLPLRPRASMLSLAYTRSFLSISVYLLLGGLTDFVIYSLDRTILGIYRPVSTVGLYEGPVRVHNLLRQFQSALMLTVMPAAAAYVGAGDHLRLRELLVRGTRYITLAVTPLAVTAMVLAGPILHVWLGRRFDSAATAMTIFVSYWLFASGLGVGQTMMLAAGRMRILLAYATVVAVLNLGISLALTPSLGLEGVVIGTSVAYLLLVPASVYIVCRTFAVPIGRFLREGFTVAFAAGGVLAAFELLAHAALPLERAVTLLPTIAVGLLAYALGVYHTGLHPREQMLVRGLVSAARLRAGALPATGRRLLASVSAGARPA
ncbi:MAG TPA: oligosaccharide flippase family protein [Solirubrobacteraceae bacterium]